MSRNPTKPTLLGRGISNSEGLPMPEVVFSRTQEKVAAAPRLGQIERR